MDTVVKRSDWHARAKKLCDEFERACRAGASPQVEALLGKIPKSRRPEMIHRLVSLELAHRLTHGEVPDLAELQARFPDHRDQVTAAFAETVGPRDDLGLGSAVLNSLPQTIELAPTLIWGQPRRTGISVLRPHTKIGNYLLLGEVGRGGMGVVYRARQISLNRLVAVKMILSGEFARDVENKRFRAEAESAANLKHPNIVPVYEIGEEGGRQYFSMELIDGPNLQQALSCGPMLPRKAAQLILSVSDAVQYAHSQGIIHRDLKPGNILLDVQDEPRVTDFGLARHWAAASNLTATGEIVGTPGFIPPEQARCQDEQLRPTVDVYSLGALLYATLTGRTPFQAENPLEVLRQVIEDAPVEPRSLNPAVPRDLETICLKCLEKNPARRFSTAAELGLELRRFLDGVPIRSRPIGRLEKRLRWCRRNPTTAGMLGIVLGSVVAILLLLWTHNRELGRLNDELQMSAAISHQLQGVAESNARQAKDALYAANVAQAATAWREADPRAVKQILDRELPIAGEDDRRGFEWRYLYLQAVQSHRTLMDLNTPLYTIVPLPDQGRLAVAGQDAVVQIIDRATGAVAQVIRTDQIEVNGIAFSPDGQEMATAGDDGTIRIWNRATGKERLRIRSSRGKQYQLLYTPDGRQLITSNDFPQIVILDSQTGEEVRTLAGHGKLVNSMIYLQDTRTLVSGSHDKTIRLWDCTKWEEVFSWTAAGQARSVVACNNQTVLVVGTNLGQLHSVDLNGRRELSRVNHHDGIESLAAHPDGGIVAAGDRGGSIRIWKIGVDGHLTDSDVTPWSAHQGIVYSLAWNADGSRLISAGSDGRVVSWNMATSRRSGPRVFELGPITTAGSDRAFYQNPATDQIVVCETAPTRTVSLWNFKTGKLVDKTEKYDNHEIGIDPHGKFFAVTTQANDLCLFKTIPGATVLPKVPAAVRWHAPGDLNRPHFFTGSDRIAISCGRTGDLTDSSVNTVWLLGLPDLDAAEQIPLPNPGEFAISPDGTLIAIGNQAGLALWHVGSRKFVWKVAQSTLIKCMAFSPDGKLLATGGDERTVTVRHVSNGTVQHELHSHRTRIRAVHFSADSRTLASASDGVLKLWHVPTGRELFEFNVPKAESFRQIEFTHDGNHLIWGVHRFDKNRDEMMVFDAADEHDEP